MDSFSACTSTAGIDSCLNCWNPPVECVECAPHWFWKDLNTCIRKYLYLLRKYFLIFYAMKFVEYIYLNIFSYLFQYVDNILQYNCNIEHADKATRVDFLTFAS